MRIADIAVAAFAAACAIVCSSGLAAAPFHKGQIDVINANLFVSNLNAQFTAGQMDSIIVLNFSSQTMHFVNNGFRLRIFRLPGGDASPKLLNAIDDCNVYLSNLLSTAGRLAHYQLHLGLLAPEDWLSIENNRVVSGRFKIVFEHPASGDTPNADGLFRLDARRSADYFKDALSILVSPPPVAPSELLPPADPSHPNLYARVAKSLSNAQAHVLDNARIETANLTCYRFPLSKFVDGASPGSTELALCDENRVAPDLTRVDTLPFDPAVTTVW